VAASRFDLAVENIRVRRALYLENSYQTAFCARERVVYQDVVARYLKLELDDGGSRMIPMTNSRMLRSIPYRTMRAGTLQRLSTS
jgi:hypothetical protein